uniref:thioesterase II family protein n=1 Tax=Ruminobacter sp. TaxID=2774296 RepID=UPI0038650473
MFLPVIRNDYELIEKWNPEKNQEPFKIDLSSFYADADTEMDRMKAEGWQNVTSRKFETRKFNGNHFYLIQHRREIIRSVADAARRQNTKRLMLP